MNKGVSRAERAEATRAALVRAATVRFAQDGYRVTSLAAVAADVGVTKGAAYHHFADKKALFAAVFTRVQRELVSAVAQRARGGSALQRLHQGCAAYLEQCTPSVVRIMLVDAPSVLGAARWNNAEDRVWLAALRALIDEARRDGLFACVDTDLAARVISVSITELAITGSPLPGRAPGAGQAVLTAVVEGLSRPTKPPRTGGPDDR